MPYAPKLSVTGLLKYDWQIGAGQVAAQFDGSYVGEQFFDISNNEISQEGGHFVADARLSYALPGDRWLITAYVKNVLARQYVVAAFDLSTFGGLSQNWPGQPRWAGVKVSYHWKQ